MGRAVAIQLMLLTPRSRVASIALIRLATDSPNRGVMNDKEAKADPWGVATTRLPVVDLPSDNRQTECVWDSYANKKSGHEEQ